MKGCPVCMYVKDKSYNWQSIIRKKIMVRGETARKKLKEVSKLIRENVPTDYSKAAYAKFLWGLDSVDDRTIVKVVNLYIRRGYYLQTKGYAYLKAIMLSDKINFSKRLANEYNSIGRPPSIVKMGDNSDKKSRETEE